MQVFGGPFVDVLVFNQTKCLSGARTGTDTTLLACQVEEKGPVRKMNGSVGARSVTGQAKGTVTLVIFDSFGMI
jgi:hypothetical protein